MSTVGLGTRINPAGGSPSGNSASLGVTFSQSLIVGLARQSPEKNSPARPALRLGLTGSPASAQSPSHHRRHIPAATGSSAIALRLHQEFDGPSTFRADVIIWFVILHTLHLRLIDHLDCL
jgi:hypothetical protein